VCELNATIMGTQFMMGSEWLVAPRHDRERVDVACIPALEADDG
jgi:hypothetical protein